MKFDIITLFPEAFSYLQESIIKRAQDKGLVEIKIHNLRDWSTDKHHKLDDKPFGGGAGMLIQVEPIYRALKDLGVYPNRDSSTKVFLTSAKGEIWNQNLAREYSKSLKHVVLICGHYEGFDHRVVEHLIDAEISVGKFVLSGGELPAMLILDSLVRLLPGSLGKDESSLHETFKDEDLKILEAPHYTRPEIFKTEEGEEWGVPKVLLSGNHKEIDKWRGENELVINN